MTRRATQVRYRDNSVQWLLMPADAAKALPDVLELISGADAEGPYGVIDWSTRPPPFSPESRDGFPWPVQRDPKTGLVLEIVPRIGDTVKIKSTGMVGTYAARYNAADGTTLLIKTLAGDKHVDMPIGGVPSEYLEAAEIDNAMRIAAKAAYKGLYRR